MAFVNEKDKKRTIDYERNYSLFYKGSQHHDGNTRALFELNLNDVRIALNARNITQIINDLKGIIGEMQRTLTFTPLFLESADALLFEVNWLYIANDNRASVLAPPSRAVMVA